MIHQTQLRTPQLKYVQQFEQMEQRDGIAARGNEIDVNHHDNAQDFAPCQA